MELNANSTTPTFNGWITIEGGPVSRISNYRSLIIVWGENFPTPGKGLLPPREIAYPLGESS